VRQEVLNDLLTADQLLSVLVKNGIVDEWKRNYGYHNVHCIEDDCHEKVMEDHINIIRYIPYNRQTQIQITAPCWVLIFQTSLCTV
jgi:hypothetical protein